MKTYPYTHARAVAIQQPSITINRKSLLLLLFTLITYTLFAQSGPGGVYPGQGGGAQAAQFNLPLVLKTFNVSLNNKKVTLNWITGHEKDLSHFVIERSTNGHDYAEAAVVFAKGNSTIVQEYSFPETLNTTVKSVVYYRLKMMDSQKRYQYSPVRIVRIVDASADVTVQAYPNPVVNELRITVPAAWQNQQVSYELYNTSGSLVKRVTNVTAGQTETLNVADIGTGTYVVKAYTKDEVASQRIVKR
jgi:hypothetical protein